MAKLVVRIFCLLIVGVICSGAQEPVAPVWQLTPDQQAQQFENNAIRSLQLRAASLPPALQENGAAIVADAQAQLTACRDGLSNGQMIWQYKKCAALALKMGMQALTQLERPTAVPA